GDAAEGLLVVTVRRANAAPTAAADTASTDEDVPVVVDVLANDADPDGDALVVASVSEPAHGRAEVVDEGRRVRYTPAAEFSGTDRFVYTVRDAGGITAVAEVTVVVAPVNDPPAAVAVASPAPSALILIQGAPEQQLTVAWPAAADPEGDAVTYAWELAADEAFENPIARFDAGAALSLAVAYGVIGPLLTA